MKYTYLAIDLASVVVPFLFTFHPRIKFYKRWMSAIPALLLTAFFFSSWDAVFVNLGVWGFSENYTLGIKILNLPVEEILFFICIPYACVFSYHCFSLFLHRNFFQKNAHVIVYTAAIGSIAGVIIWSGKLYPSVTFLLLAGLLLIVAKQKFLPHFFFTYVIMLIPFLIVNGLLTGTGIKEPVVWYNQNEITGIRIATIPFEDFFYGMLLMLMNVTLIEALEGNIISWKSR